MPTLPLQSQTQILQRIFQTKILQRLFEIRSILKTQRIAFLSHMQETLSMLKEGLSQLYGADGEEFEELEEFEDFEKSEMFEEFDQLDELDTLKSLCDHLLSDQNVLSIEELETLKALRYHMPVYLQLLLLQLASNRSIRSKGLLLFNNIIANSLSNLKNFTQHITMSKENLTQIHKLQS